MGWRTVKTIDKLKKIIDEFIPKFTILPVYNSLDIYAKEKARLRKAGLIIDDFDLLIGATAIAQGYILVTDNVKDFNIMNSIKIENWMIRN